MASLSCIKKRETKDHSAEEPQFNGIAPKMATAPMYLRDKVLSVNDFELGKTLGTGSFGRVRFVRYTKGGETDFYALKILKKSAIIRLKQVDHIASEKAILMSLSHPFIVNLFGCFHDSRYLYLLLEYVVGGEFFTHLRKAGRFENETAKFYSAGITLIFEYLHARNCIYRDLKPENVLLGSDGYLKLTDFGFAKVIEYRTYTLCGTPEYIAPEVLLNKGHGKPVDWWTLGILVYEMVVGYPPFVDDDPMGIYQKILAGKIVFPKFFDKTGRTLVKKLLTADLGKRYGNLKNGVEDIKKSKYLGAMDWTEYLAKALPSPYKPQVKSATDTSNFEEYPDSEELAAAVSSNNDPFAEWSVPTKNPGH